MDFRPHDKMVQSMAKSKGDVGRRSTVLLIKSSAPRLMMIAVVVSALVSLLLHMRLQQTPQSSARNLVDFSLASAVRQAFQDRVGPQKKQASKPQSTELEGSNHWDDFVRQTGDAEQAILDFFHGDPRALQDGVPFGGKEDSLSVLTERLADRISLCSREAARNQSQQYRQRHCTLRVVFTGGAQVSGRDIFKNQTYPYQVEPRLRAVVEATGLELEVLNNAMDSDLSREGPQTTHMCIQNFVGQSADIVSWDLESMMQGNPAAQIEAFVRWTAALKPALILFNRAGPHTRSRRGIPRGVVNLVGNHDATIYEDLLIPEQRQDSYRDSEKFQDLWMSERNSFWEKIMDQYSSFLDFAAIDPSGSIWHLDHLEEFSNMAFDADKPLPLYDCPSPPHPPPCDQIPPYVIRHLQRDNQSLADLPRDHSGVFCGTLTGCRHHWYGGPRSHAVRAALNALPILRALHAAAKLLKARALEDGHSSIEKQLSTNSKDFSIRSLPPPEYCSKFCDMAPTCMSSYAPNIGHHLESVILSNETSPARLPRLGACHWAHDPDFAIRNLDQRMGPLGWNDRKYAYRLAKEAPSRKKVQQTGADPVEASRTAIAFNSTNPGPLVICEPPCYIDECSPKRMRPFVKHVALELDGNLLPTPKGPPTETEVGGMFCRVIAKSVPAGNHILRISTEVVSPEHVMFSHLVTFA